MWGRNAGGQHCSDYQHFHQQFKLDIDDSHLKPIAGDREADRDRDREIAYGKRTVEDSSLAKGTREVRTKGVAGVKTLTYEVTLTNGVETSRKLLKAVITKKPVTQVIAIGTKEEQQAPSCDPNYEGACVPIASDVDCAGGSGNGPAYVQGPVTVVGSDIYDLDRDGDGVGCDS